MRHTPESTHTRPFALLVLLGAAAGTFQPTGAGAQLAPRDHETGTLGAAVAEARRTPFHVRAALPGLTIPAPSPSSPVPPPLLTVAAQRGASFPRILLASLVAAAGADYVFMHSFTCRFGDGYCRVPDDLRYGYFGLGIVLAGGGPPLGAKLVGGSYSQALIGSVLGFSAGIGLVRLVDHVAAVIAVPFIHALGTAAFGSLR